MVITDTHAHLYIEAFDQDRDEMIERARSEGIQRFFLPAIDSSYTESMLTLKNSYPEHMHLMMGLHPTHVKPDTYKDELDHVTEMLATGKFVAVGEIGIDLYWDTSTLDIQKEAFRHQIDLAKKYKLPIVIHSRESFDEIFDVLEQEAGDDLFGIFHCFTGSIDQARRAVGLNFKLGIGGVVTFKNGKIDQFLDKIGLEHIVLETDSPYLSPVPFRGKRNESAYIIHVLNKLSDIYRISKEEIAAVTTANSQEVFNI
ncbi:MAG: TatD family hydrolase [Flavobacteriaceae bacterium]|nr:TatD family hydrolase [Bacteroidia bacterium]NNL80122.1 TatD family hydrolase [Flavobacteriaceae bacterium]